VSTDEIIAYGRQHESKFLSLNFMFSCLTSEHFHTHQNYGDDDDDVLYIRTRIEDSLVHIRGEYVPKYEINFQPQNCMHKSSLDIAL
jgi:hypothetical protein